MSDRIVIPMTNWHTALAQAIKTAPTGATIICHTAAMQELAERAAGPERLNRPDLHFILEER